MIIAGMWFGETHPVITTFMGPLRKTLKTLETSGTLCFFINLFFLPKGLTISTKSKLFTVTATVLTGVYDIPAKNDVLGLVSHRGQFACSRCLHPGKVITTAKG